jgi:hypothetical protein
MDNRIQVSFQVTGAMKRAIDEYCLMNETGITAVILEALKTQKIPVPRGQKAISRRRAVRDSYPEFTKITAVIPLSVHHALQERQIEQPLSATDILMKGLAKLGISASD